MGIDRDAQTVSFEPDDGQNFEALSMEIPDVASGPDKKVFERDLSRAVQRCCGQAACSGEASLVYARYDTPAAFRDSPNFLWLEGASITCDATDCPLGNPGAGDREPRIPSPDPSVLAAEISE